MDFEIDVAPFRDHPDDHAIVVVWIEDEGMRVYVVVNPNTSRDVMAAFGPWLVEILDRIRVHGLACAVEMDDWQLRSDGRYQKWMRGVVVDDPFAG